MVSFNLGHCVQYDSLGIGADPGGQGGQLTPQLIVLRPPLLSDHSDGIKDMKMLQPYNKSNTKSVKIR